MFINFCIAGRLGNAIFRYMSSVIMCILYNGTYTINNNQMYDCNDELFIHIFETLINKKRILNLKNIFKVRHKIKGINMTRFYQHDLIYKLYKKKIIIFIRNNPTHFILPDTDADAGIEYGNNIYEKFFMKDIIDTPNTFNKIYKNVLHIRLEDVVTYNLYIDSQRIINLLDKNIILDSQLCIVCKQPTTEFEFNYIKQITDYLYTKNIKYNLEHNDTITDYYIMKEAENLICSKSTLSWCAAFFSDKIKKCYLPDYIKTPNSTCTRPIDNTELY